MNVEYFLKVFRKEENGCGTKIEIYPWAIVVNMLSYRVLLDISDTIYTIESYEIIAPPCIEVNRLFLLALQNHFFFTLGLLFRRVPSNWVS